MENESAPPPPASRRRIVVGLGGGLIVLAAVAAYRNSFSVPFLFDDRFAVGENPSIRHLWPLRGLFSIPAGLPSAGRPFLNLTFALNYAFGGTSLAGYHAVNLLIHIFGGLTLFGIARRTLGLPKLRAKFGASGPPLALAIALIWTLHPLLTESVTYISQRAESLMGLCYLLTLYCFIRHATGPAPRAWQALSVVACALGMASKEVMVSAPLMVFLYDRTFVSGTFRAAWKRHRVLHTGLASTWVLLAACMTGAGQAVGYGGTFTAWTYALTESRVVVRYLGLAFWPHPLVFDYGTEIGIAGAGQAAPYLILLALLLLLTAVAIRRWPAAGFLGGWFFLILAPTSSVVPVVWQPMAESRMYLPAAALVTLAVIGAYRLVGRKSLVALAALAVACGGLTAARNQDYRTGLSIWSDTLAKCPGSSRAHNNLGNALNQIPGRESEAQAHFEEAVRLRPDYAEAHYNLGAALAKIPGRRLEAIAHYEVALQINPDYAEAHNNLGAELADYGRMDEARFHFEEAVRLKPDHAGAQDNLGNALLEVPGRLSEAILHFEEAVRLKPEWAKARRDLGRALSMMRRTLHKDTR